MGLITPKNRLVVEESDEGVCLWQMPSGGYLSDGDGYLSVQGKMRDPFLERKMREAVKYWTGSTDGKPVWFSGYRKVTQDEYEDQMARMEEGKIPDVVDEARQAEKYAK